MPSIEVRDVPEHIYRLLAEEAENEQRSLAQQVVAVLARGLHVQTDARLRRRELLRQIQGEKSAPRHTLTDPAKLIREDRRR